SGNEARLGGALIVGRMVEGAADPLEALAGEVFTGEVFTGEKFVDAAAGSGLAGVVLTGVSGISGIGSGSFAGAKAVRVGSVEIGCALSGSTAKPPGPRVARLR